jgi:membrane protein DedA with SNARE-associated domain
MDPTRLINFLYDSLSVLSGPLAYATIVGILFICGLGVPIPEDLTLLAAGLLAANQSISLPGALIAGFVGVMLGDALLFFMGRKFGKRVFALPGLRAFFTEQRVARAEAKIRHNGPFICFIARFLPGLRSPIFAMSGALGVKPMTFFLLDGFAALISVPVWVYLGFWFGNNLDEALARAKHIQVYLFSGLALLVVGYIGYRFWRLRREKAAAAKTSVGPGVTELQKSGSVGNRHP